MKAKDFLISDERKDFLPLLYLPWMNAPTPAPTACIPPVLNVWEKFIVPLGLLYLLICGLSASVDSKVFRSIVLNSNRGIFVGLFCQFLLMPFLGFIAVMTFIGKNNYPIGMTLLVVTSSPGGGFSKYANFCYISWHTLDITFLCPHPYISYWFSLFFAAIYIQLVVLTIQCRPCAIYCNDVSVINS